MAFSENPSRQSLIPSFLYTSSSMRSNNLEQNINMRPGFKNPARSLDLPAAVGAEGGFLIPAPKEKGIEMYSPAYYWASAAGGLLSCGLTHTAVTPLDIVKCNMQIDPAKYKSVSSGFGTLLKEQGIRGFFKGWAPTFVGYSAQGAFKYGLYEYFKKYYSDMAGPEYSAKYKTFIYLAGSASAEVIADVALCPFEAVKVRVQTQPGFARGLADGVPKIVKAEGVSGLYKGIVPLWGRQIPCKSIDYYVFTSTPSRLQKRNAARPCQLGVSFTGGYIAGVFCAVISHPADNLVSFLNNAKGATVGDVSCEKARVMGYVHSGSPLRIVMVGTLTGAQWGIYDASKVFFGLPTTGGSSVPAPK
ncbi:mitochondrial phosphate carrier protein 3 mitochondrial [Phtheirospermum japonicum]|uniref:Mitochondrial phosphate carrier protein 3 mitochondrial n=1 Tax=Phtheirospermum japonicum TaxID=374723 RepID=A0A830BCB0_9LAMI|nr:mitochondrial phosphate carrier protein 3 mitochondrial [Phtheirospermum japonicum]